MEGRERRGGLRLQRCRTGHATMQAGSSTQQQGATREGAASRASTEMPATALLPYLPPFGVWRDDAVRAPGRKGQSPMTMVGCAPCPPVWMLCTNREALWIRRLNRGNVRLRPSVVGNTTADRCLPAIACRGGAEYDSAIVVPRTGRQLAIGKGRRAMARKNKQWRHWRASRPHALLRRTAPGGTSGSDHQRGHRPALDALAYPGGNDRGIGGHADHRSRSWP